MNLLRIQDLHVAYGANTILHGVNMEIESGERVALVGHNGTGKSTLLRTITGLLSPDQGEIIKAGQIRIGYLAQMPPLHEDKTIWQEAREVFHYVDELEKKWQELAQSLSQAKAFEAEGLAEKYARAEQEFTNAGGYEVDSRVRKVLAGMGFPADRFEQSVQSLSGGQKTRLQLAKLLLEEPDLLLLDEPTNHLDLETVEWLEDHLMRYRGSVLVVSHDRFFLDRVAQITYELAQGVLIRYAGNYSAYVAMKELQAAQALEAYERQQEEIQRLETFVNKNIARATTTSRAQSRRKTLEKMERLAPPTKDKHAYLTFPVNEVSGKSVLELKQVAIIRSGRTLFPPLNLQVWRGEKIAITGANGIGKSSLLRAILEQSADQGSIHFGTKIKTAYFEQEFSFADPERTVLDELWAAYPMKTETEIRTRLGHLLFSGEDVFKQVKNLSGGERNRLQLAILSWTGANLLIFDEPTNHLDIPAKEVLEKALMEYPGTLLFVSHDRFFINRLCHRLVHLSTEGNPIIEGNYLDFLKWREESRIERNEPTITAPSASEQAYSKRKQERSDARKLQTKMDRLEKEIARLEDKKQELEMMLSEPELYEDRERADAVQKEFLAVTAELEGFYEEWTITASEIE